MLGPPCSRDRLGEQLNIKRRKARPSHRREPAPSLHDSTHRKRQVEFIELLEKIDRSTPNRFTTIHIVCDNVSMRRGKETRAWLEKHKRFKLHFTPVHCSWMNQVERWFSILQRKRLAAPNFKDLATLEERVEAFISEWNKTAHPFEWKSSSFDKVLAKIESAQLGTKEAA